MLLCLVLFKCNFGQNPQTVDDITSNYGLYTFLYGIFFCLFLNFNDTHIKTAQDFPLTGTKQFVFVCNCTNPLFFIIIIITFYLYSA